MHSSVTSTQISVRSVSQFGCFGCGAAALGIFSVRSVTSCKMSWVWLWLCRRVRRDESGLIFGRPLADPFQFFDQDPEPMTIASR
jgi:hypothetical protein